MVSIAYAESSETNAELAKAANDLLRRACLKCHGESFRGNSRLDFGDPRTLLDEDLLVPGDAEASVVYQRIRDDEMPEDEPLSTDQKSLIRQWIDAGAPAATDQARSWNLQAVGDEVTLIRADLGKIDHRQRRHFRYLSLRHLHNDARVSAEQLNRAAAAISKMVNSISLEPEIRPVTAVNETGTLLRVDLRDYGWRAEDWATLESNYPYGLRYRSREASRGLDGERELAQEMGVRHLSVRADWFVDTVARPSFYHRFLRLPKTLAALEAHLGVDNDSDVLNHRVALAGFATSGVSVGNRLLQRHRSRDGAYWKSFDFADSSEQGNLFRNPFPQLTGDKNRRESTFGDATFQHDGGEMIFSLPNGLQGYFLTDAKGNRLDRGPITVVRDNLQTGGTAEVINAVSCLACHSQGMIEFQDTVRAGHSLSGELASEVERLYRTHDDMQQLVDQDRERFARAANQAMATWDIETDQLDPSTEPIGWLVRRYGRDLDLQTAAAEVEVTPEILEQLILANRSLQQLGLKPLTTGQRVKRSSWSDRSAFVSPMQEVARIAGSGTPIN